MMSYSLLCTFVQPTDLTPNVAAAKIKEEVVQFLYEQKITVRAVLVFHAKLKILYSPESEDLLLREEILSQLRGGGYTPVISREQKARRTVLIRGADSFVFQNLIQLLSAAHPQMHVIESFFHQGLMKISLNSRAHAISIVTNGVTLGCFEYPPTACSLEVHVRVDECFSCYEPNPEHSSTQCPFRDRKLCSTCGSEGHRYNQCPGTTDPVCLVCSRRNLPANHSTRTQKCPIRKEVVSTTRQRMRARARSQSVNRGRLNTRAYREYTDDGPSFRDMTTGRGSSANTHARTEDQSTPPQSPTQTHARTSSRAPPTQAHTRAPSQAPPVKPRTQPPPPAPHPDAPSRRPAPPPHPDASSRRPASATRTAAPSRLPAHPPSHADAVYDPRLTQEEIDSIEAERAKAPLRYANKVANAAHTYGLRCEVAAPGIYDTAVEAFFVKNRETPLKFPALVDPKVLLKSFEDTYGSGYQPYKPTKKKSKGKKKNTPSSIQTPAAAATPPSQATAAHTAQQAKAAVNTAQQAKAAANTAQQAKAAANTAQQAKAAANTAKQAKAATKPPKDAAEGTAASGDDVQKLQASVKKLQEDLAAAQAQITLYQKRLVTLKQMNAQMAAKSQAPAPRAALADLVQPRAEGTAPSQSPKPQGRSKRSRSLDFGGALTRKQSPSPTPLKRKTAKQAKQEAKQAAKQGSTRSSTSSLYDLALTAGQRARTPSPDTQHHTPSSTPSSTQASLPFSISQPSPLSPLPSPMASPRHAAKGRRTRTPSPRDTQQTRVTPTPSPALYLSPSGQSPQSPHPAQTHALSPSILSPQPRRTPSSSPTPSVAASSQDLLPFHITPTSPIHPSSPTPPPPSQRSRMSTPSAAAKTPHSTPASAERDRKAALLKQAGSDFRQLAEALEAISGMKQGTPDTPMPSPTSSLTFRSSSASPSLTPYASPASAGARTPSPSPAPSPAQTRSRSRIKVRDLPLDDTPDTTDHRLRRGNVQ